MRPESIALLQALLDHHSRACAPVNGRFPRREDCVIAFGDLCDDAGTRHILRSIGMFLLEIAEWCAARRHPPINALAVQAETGLPGDNYDVAPGCTLLGWPQEADNVIAYRGHPETVAA